MTREELIAIVTERMAGSQPAARHTHIECWCPDRAHRREDYDEGCYCPDCAAKAAVALGYPATDTELETEGPDDGPRWCQECGRLITLRDDPERPWGITSDGALEELVHYESGLGAERGEPKTPDDWRVFLLCVDAIAEEHLPRVEAVVARAVASQSVCENCDDTGTCPCGGSGCAGCEPVDPGRCRCHRRLARGTLCPQEDCHESCLCNVGNVRMGQP